MLGLTLLFFLLGGGSLVLRFEMGAIRFYRKALSPGVRYMAVCRYETSCSAYALESLEGSGLLVGNLKMTRRLLFCSPIGWVVEKTSGKPLYPHRVLPGEKAAEQGP